MNDPCPHCPAYAASAKAQPWREFVCECGAVYVNNVDASADTALQKMQKRAPMSIERGEFHMDAPPWTISIQYQHNIDAIRQWQWEPNAREDMAALAFVPGTAEPVALSLETYEDRDRREERRLVRRIQGHRRLAWLRAKNAQYADVVWFAFGRSGPDLVVREAHGGVTLAERIAHECQRPGQHVAFRKWREFQLFGHDEKRANKCRKLVAETLPRDFGERLVDFAVQAYEQDVWPELIPAVPARVVKKTRREELAERMREAIDGAKRRMGIA